MTTFGSRLSTCYRVLEKERLLIYGVDSPGQSRGISPLQGVGEGETRGSDVPSRRISPLTLLSYKWGYHLRWPQRQGERERFFFLKKRLCYEKAGRCTYMVKPPVFFPPLPKPYWSRCTYMVKPLGCIGEPYTRWYVA